jgi:predicted ferric reductase
MDYQRISGWLSVTLLAIGFWTSLKTPGLNRIAGGLRKQLHFHHWLGLAGIAAIVGHLILVCWEAAPNLLTLFDITDVAMTTGWAAFLATAIAGADAFRFRSAPYRRWRYVHLILILSFTSGFLHTVVIWEPRTAAEWLPIAAVGLTGLTGIVVSVILPHTQYLGFSGAISQQKNLRSDLFLQSVSFDATSKIDDFRPGHFIYVQYQDRIFTRLWHPYTIVGFRPNRAVELLIKARGRDTNLLQKIHTPCPIRVRGPFGTPFWGEQKDQLWIAYGVGLAIFLCASRTIPAEFERKIHLIYCDKAADKLVFANEFNALQLAKSNFSWEAALGEGAEVLTGFAGKVSQWVDSYGIFRVCGHPGFQNAVKEMLIDSGIPPKFITLEGVY